MIDDLETSSEDEAKKLFLQEILSLQKEIKRYRLTSSKVDYSNKEGVLLWKSFEGW